MPTTIDVDQVREELRTLIAEDPNRTNNGECALARETPDGPVPNCIFGVWLSLHGVTGEELLKADEDWGGETTVDSCFGLDFWKISDKTSDAAKELLRSVQYQADNNTGMTPWGTIDLDERDPLAYV